MPYDPSTGNFSLLNNFGTGTSNDNNFPNAVGLTLTDLATGLSISTIISQSTFQANVLQPNVSNNISTGYTFTTANAGTISSGTFTPDPTIGNYQVLISTGAFTLAAPTHDCAIDILLANHPGAGTITFSGYTYASGNTGDPYVTTNGYRFIFSIRRMAGYSTFVVKALQ